MLKNKHNTVVVLFLDMLGAKVVDMKLGDSYLMPTLSKLKKQGVSYNNFYSCGWNTITSMPSFFSGHRTLDKALFNDGISDDSETIAEFFNKNGFHTSGVAASRAIVNLYSFGRGFDKFYEEVDFSTWSAVLDRYYIKYYNNLCKKVDDNGIYKQYYIEFLDDFFCRMIEFIEKKISNNTGTKKLDYDCFDYKSLLSEISTQYNIYKSSKNEYIEKLYKKDLKFFGDIINIDKFKFFGFKVFLNSFFIKFILFFSLVKKIPLKYWFLRGIYKDASYHSVSPNDVIDIAINEIQSQSKSFVYIHLPVPHDRKVTSTGKLSLKRLFIELDSLRDYISNQFSSGPIKSYIEFRKYKNYHRYLSSARHADDCLHALKKWLDSNLEDYSLVVTSDHGNQWCSRETSVITKKDDAFNAKMIPEYYHVPFVMYSPTGKSKSVDSYTSSTSFSSIIKNNIFGLNLEECTDGEIVIDRERYIIYEHTYRGTLDYLHKYAYISILGKKTHLICECDIPHKSIIRVKFTCNSVYDQKAIYSQLIKNVESIILKLYKRLYDESFDALKIHIDSSTKNNSKVITAN